MSDVHLLLILELSDAAELDRLPLLLRAGGTELGVVLRCKARPELGRALIEPVARACADSGSSLILSSRLGLPHPALHLPDAGGAQELRAAAQGGAAVGRSCHDAVGIDTARRGGARWITLSPVRAVPGKARADQALGWERFAALAAGFPGPTYALGGVTPAEAARARRHGAAGCAAIRGLWESSDPERAVASYLAPWR